mgnify:CR=1 FL=1|jgi:hypothetical protein
MSSLNKRFGDGQRFEIKQFATEVGGFSPTWRGFAPQMAQQNLVRRDVNGNPWRFVKATAAVATPTATPAVVTVTVSNGGLASVSAVVTAGTGYVVGEVVPVHFATAGLLNGSGALRVATVSATGGILTATIERPGFAYAAGNLNCDPAAFAWTLCTVVPADGTLTAAAGTARSYAPFAINEFGWVLDI